MGTVLALSGKIKSGKSTVGSVLAQTVNYPYVSFGDYVRFITRQRGLPDVRENLQRIGEELVETDAEVFCRAVLAQADWKPGQSLVIDGIRHRQVDELLRKLVSPSKYILTFLEVNEQTRQERLHKEGIDDQELIERIESHSTEQQVTTVLRQIADYRIDGNEPLPDLIERLKKISSDSPQEVIIPANLSFKTVIEAIDNMSLSEQREVLARTFSLQKRQAGNETWKSIRFSDSLRVVAYDQRQESYVKQLRDLLQQGVLARLENESDGTYEIYGLDRTYYVTMTPNREFVALLGSWTPDDAPREIILQDVE